MCKADNAQGQDDGKADWGPCAGGGSVMFYNKDLFKQAGLGPEKPPTTMAEDQADAEKVTALGDGNYGTVFSGGCGGCNIFSMGPYVWAQGGDVLSKDGTKAQFSSKEVGTTLTMYRDMWKNGDMPELVPSDGGSNAADAFKAGQVGIFTWGDFYLSPPPDPPARAAPH